MERRDARSDSKYVSYDVARPFVLVAAARTPHDCAEQGLTTNLEAFLAASHAEPVCICEHHISDERNLRGDPPLRAWRARPVSALGLQTHLATPLDNSRAAMYRSNQVRTSASLDWGRPGAPNQSQLRVVPLWTIECTPA